MGKNRYGFRVLGEGISISNDTRQTNLNNNDLVVGSAGSSKTGSVVYTQLKTLDDSSLIVSDTKGRLVKMMGKELVERGYKVRLLDFANPEKSCKYNPLDHVGRTSNGGYREVDIARLAAALIPDSMIDNREPFWALSGRNFLEFFLAYTLYALPEEDHNMYTVARLFRVFRMQNGDEGFLDWIDEHPDSLVATRYAQIKGSQTAEKMFSSICAFVDLALAPFMYDEFRGVFDPAYKTSSNAYGAGKPIDIESVGKKKTVIFLNVSDTDHSMDALVNIFYTQALQTLVRQADANDADGGRLKVPVRIVMDDFASSALIPDFDRIISIIRSRDIWVTLCLQSLTQLESLYTSAQATTIINNCDHLLFLGGNDIKSAEFIGTRALCTPEVVLAMDRTKEYFIEGGDKARLVNKIRSYAYVPDSDMSLAV